jgi:hypothetical protein
VGECGIIDLDFIIPMQPKTILSRNRVSEQGKRILIDQEAESRREKQQRNGKSQGIQ